jgi:hypothetical protein
LGIDVSPDAAKRRRLNLQSRLWNAAHAAVHGSEKYKSFDELHRAIRKYLLNASDQRLIRESPAVIRNLLLQGGPDGDGTREIAIGNTRNFNRSKELPHLSRTSDEAWFDFQLLVAPKDGQVEILAYDFELRLPKGSPFDFVRIDLNPPAKGQADDGLRSHFHLASDDDGLVVQAPVMSPLEILDLFVHGIRSVGRVRRQPTQTE